ncbi:hypothetical protein ACFWUZ_07300 [Streptomyces sp. NPDC058646]
MGEHPAEEVRGEAEQFEHDLEDGPGDVRARGPAPGQECAYSARRRVLP